MLFFSQADFGFKKKIIMNYYYLCREKRVRKSEQNNTRLYT